MPPTTKKDGADGAAPGSTEAQKAKGDTQPAEPTPAPAAPAVTPAQLAELMARFDALQAENQRLSAAKAARDEDELKAQVALLQADKIKLADQLAPVASAEPVDHSGKARIRYNGAEREAVLCFTGEPIKLTPFGYVPAHKRVVRDLLLEKFKFPPTHANAALNGKPKFTLVNEEGDAVNPKAFLEPGDIFIPFGY